MDAQLQVGAKLRKGILGFPFEIVAVFHLIKKSLGTLKTLSHMSEMYLIPEM